MAMTAVLREAVAHSLLWNNYKNATFLAERLVAEERSEETLHLLATTHVHAGQHGYAYSILKGLSGQACRFLFARCCLELGRLQEGELALTGALFPGSTTNMEEFSQTRGAAYALLGNICERASRSEQAIECYRKSLEENPFLWTSFEALCKLGAQPNPDEFFQARDDLNISRRPSVISNSSAGLSVTSESSLAFVDEGAVAETPLPTPGKIFGDLGAETPATPAQFQRGGLFTPATPRFAESFALAGSPAAVPIVSALGSPAPWSYTTPSPAVAAAAAAAPEQPPPPPAAPRTPPAVRKSSRIAKTKEGSPGLRRSMRLFSSKGKSKEPKKTKLSKDSTEAAGGDSKRRVEFAEPAVGSGGGAEAEPNNSATGIEETIALFKQLGHGMAALEQYKCQDAITNFEELPERHYRTAWTYCQIGRAHFELADYKEADKCFRMARRLAPYKSHGMEIYSTTLWHLREETALSYLAHEVTSADKFSPEAWCVVGNCFSLQKEHDQAVKFFERAVQLDPSFSYAYTLLGHEYVYNEDFSKALNCFRTAVHKDPRHYNAWYGLGMIYYRQEKFDLAEYHFAKAIQINTASSILLCYLGIVQHAQGKSEQALENMTVAGKIKDDVPLVKFNMAVVLAALGRNEEALQELEALKRIAPKESSVYFLMGKVLRKLGRRDEAMMHLSWALDLDPKGNNNLIKEAIDKHHMPDDDDPEGDSSIRLPEITSPTMPSPVPPVS